MMVSKTLLDAVQEKNWSALQSTSVETLCNLRVLDPDFSMSKPISLNQRISFLVSVLLFPITLLNWGRMKLSQNVLSLVYPTTTQKPDPLFRNNVLRTLSASEGVITRHVCIENNGNRYSGLLVGKQEHFESGQWIVHGTGNAELAEEVIGCMAHAASEKGFGALIMNAPQSGASEGLVSPECMGETHDAGISFLETALKAKTIVLSGRSMGAAAMSKTIEQHEFKKDVQYSVIREVTFSSISSMVRSLGDEILRGGLSPAGIAAEVVKVATTTLIIGLVHILGLNLDQSAASKKLNALGIRDVILQKGEAGRPVSDRVIPATASLAHQAQQQGLYPKQEIIFGTDDHNMLDIYEPIKAEMERLANSEVVA